MRPEQGLIRQIMLWLYQAHARTLRRFNSQERAFYERLAKTFPPFDERALDAQLRNTKPPQIDFLRSNRFLFLEPAEKIMPILALWYDFRRSTRVLRLRLALFLPGNSGNPVAIGYRFESPEGQGVHNYQHAQLFREFRRDNMKTWRLPTPRWLPESQPSFALDANGNNPIALIVCMLISLYGLDFVSKLRDAQFWNQLKGHLQEMHCIPAIDG